MQAARWVAACLAAPLLCAPAFAVPFVGFHHTAWSTRDGAPADIWALAQASDGYLWLGTGSGLFRFDGVRFERIIPKGSSFPHSNIRALLFTANGDLLIGYEKGGISRLSRGTLTNYAGFPAARVVRIVEDASGDIWVHSDIQLARGGLRRLSGGRWKSFTAGLPLTSTIATMVLGGQNALWALAGGAFYKLPQRQHAFQKMLVNPFPGSPLKTEKEGGYTGGLPLAADFSLWFVDDEAYGPISPPSRSAGPRPPLRQAARTFFTHDGDFWLSARDHGVQRIARVVPSARRGTRKGSSPQIFGEPDGLTSNAVGSILEDREGDVWVGTSLGLDRFRRTDVNSMPDIKQAARESMAIVPAANGGLYVAHDKLYLFQPQQGLAPLVYLPKWFNENTALCAGSSETAWILNDGVLRRFSGRVSESVALPKGVDPAEIRSCAEDSTGRLWLAIAGSGLYRRDLQDWRPVGPAAPFYNHALLVADDEAAMWAYLDDTPLRRLQGNKVQSFGSKDGLSVGDLNIVYQGRRAVLVGGDSGLARFDGTRFWSLEAPTSSPFRRITGIVQTDQDTWLNTASGAVLLATADLEKAFKSGRWPTRYRVYDRQDGMAGAQQDALRQTAVRGSDGRIWFISTDGLSWIDPGHLSTNNVPPPVTIEKVIADGHVYEDLKNLTLPPGTANIEIDYTALSLRTPERVAFRYKVDGVDKVWVDPGQRRQAFYTKLGPGQFTFRVIAANDSGVWNRSGATLNLTIQPKVTERWEFRLACFIAAILMAIGLIFFNIRKIAVRLRERLEERLRERERIARELHDTLLQGFQGLQLHFQSVVETLAAESSSRQKLERALQMTDSAIVEARGRVRELRASGMATDLPQHLRTKSETFVGPTAPTLKIVEQGRPRELDHIVEREVAAVAEEAMFNVIKHAYATEMEICIKYAWWKFELTVRDNGKGFDRGALTRLAGKHFGLVGMRERVRRLHGSFLVQAKAEGGTEVRISIPGPVAYGSMNWLFDRLSGS